VVALRLGRPGGPPAPPDPAAGLDPPTAFARGLELAQAGHDNQSLPYFRHAAVAGSATWVVHHDYSSALANAALESRAAGRFGQRVVRSSIERVALVRESLHQLDVAAALADAPRDRAVIEVSRGETLETWGLPYDALECYRRAIALDPAAARLAPRVSAGR
jgi:tetratricopeptide (TPR) repeat protein